MRIYREGGTWVCVGELQVLGSTVLGPDPQLVTIEFEVRGPTLATVRHAADVEAEKLLAEWDAAA